MNLYHLVHSFWKSKLCPSADVGAYVQRLHMCFQQLHHDD